jgi:fermentation-respiration switch protein FrsA (DUF1100 family)
MTAAALAVVALVALTIAVRWIEPRLAFFPLAGEDVTPASLGIPFRAHTIETADGERLRLWHLERDAPIARVVYFHGNGGNLSMWSDVLAGLWREGFDVVAIDYRGYGLSTGRPSETGLYRDVDACLAFVFERLPRVAPLIYWGRSLGTPLAAYGASRRPPGGVVLEAGFPSMRSVVETNAVLWALSWLSSYRFPTSRWMQWVQRPVLVIHGDRDSVIPYRLGQRLYDSHTGTKTMVTIRGGDHNDPSPAQPEIYWTAVRSFTRRLPAALR